MGSRSSVAAGGLAHHGLGRSALPALLAMLLAGCPTVDLGDTPTDIGLCNPPGGLPYFQDQIWSNFIVRGAADMGCARAGCHVAGGNGLDFPTPVDYAAAYRRSQLYLNCGTPDASPLLTKPLAGIEPHGGGDFFASTADPAVQVFLDWFQ